MTLPNNVVLFGDQTVDPCPIIKQLYRQSRDSLTLQTLFRQSYDAIRREIATSEASDRALFPSFDSFQDLAEKQNERHNEAVSTVLLCIAQLGLLLM